MTACLTCLLCVIPSSLGSDIESGYRQVDARQLVSCMMCYMIGLVWSALDRRIESATPVIGVLMFVSWPILMFIFEKGSDDPVEAFV